MRRVTLFLSVMAIAALAATSAQATFVYGVYMDASGGIPNTPPNGTNPYATSNGRVWINTGSGPTLMTQDVNAQLLVYDTALTTPAWTVLEGYPYNSGDPGEATSSTLLLTGPDDPDLGTPPAVGDITFWTEGGYPGAFLDPSGNIYVIPGADGGRIVRFPDVHVDGHLHHVCRSRGPAKHLHRRKRLCSRQTLSGDQPRRATPTVSSPICPPLSCSR